MSQNLQAYDQVRPLDGSKHVPDILEYASDQFSMD